LNPHGTANHGTLTVEFRALGRLKPRLFDAFTALGTAEEHIQAVLPLLEIALTRRSE